MGASILVVENDVALQTLFRTLLTRSGFEAECVGDGAQALGRLTARPYSVVLLDLMIPAIDGFDLLNRLARTRPALLRQIIVTTGVSSRDLAKIDSKRVYAVIRKPFDINRLLDAVVACARDRGTPAGEPGGSGGGDVELRTLSRVEEALPRLRALFAASPRSDRELLLRAELRRVIGELGCTLMDAAELQSDGERSERCERLGRSATLVAAAPPRLGH